MPPKKETPAAAVVTELQKPLKLKVDVTIDATSEQYKHVDGLHLRFCSEWFDCITTESILGGKSWTINSYIAADGSDKLITPPPPVEAVPPPKGKAPAVPAAEEIVITNVESGVLRASWENDFSFLSDEDHLLKTFNRDPGIFAFIMGREEQKQDDGVRIEDKIVPLSFLYVDCSSYLLNIDTVLTGRCHSVFGVSVQLSVSTSQFLVPRERTMALDPFVFAMHRCIIYLFLLLSSLYIVKS